MITDLSELMEIVTKMNINDRGPEGAAKRMGISKKELLSVIASCMTTISNATGIVPSAKSALPMLAALLTMMSLGYELGKIAEGKPEATDKKPAEKEKKAALPN